MFFLGHLSRIWVGGGADSQTFGGIYQPLFFSPKVPKCGWAVKTQKNHKDTGRTQRHRYCNEFYLQLHPLIFQMGSSDDRLVIINNIIQLPQCVHLIRNFHIV